MKTRVFFLIFLFLILLAGCKEGTYLLEGVPVHIAPEPLLAEGVLCRLEGNFSNPQTISPVAAEIVQDGKTLLVSKIPASTDIFTFSVKGDITDVLPGNVFPAAMWWHSQYEDGVETITIESYSATLGLPAAQATPATTRKAVIKDGWTILETATGTAVFKVPMSRQATTWAAKKSEVGR